MLDIKKETIFQTGDSEEIWQRFCGFLDLTLDEFMEIQKTLLEEQFDLVGSSPLWKKLLNNQKPKTLEEFREIAPITSYFKDYAEYIGEEGKEDFLATKPAIWVHTSGRGGKFKWIPWTETALEKYGDAMMGVTILACADRKGDVNIGDRCRTLALMAPSPYLSGVTSQVHASRFNAQIIPPIGEADSLEFQKRIQLGFKLALQNGVDVVGALSTVLVKAGENMAENAGKTKFSISMLRPQVMYRMLRAIIRSKREKRPILPKDLWPAKGITCGGTDTSIYREKLKYYWGKVAHEVYCMSETGTIAMQSWTKKDMTFYPYCTFFEFIPESDWAPNHNNNIKPHTLLLNELEVGGLYELVVTNFYGMHIMRCRSGDIIKVTALEDKETGIKLPQIVFYGRADGLIDLYSIVRFDEKTVWEAINSINMKYEDWSARKEYVGAKPILSIYLELKEDANAEMLANTIHEHLLHNIAFYTEAIQEMETKPIKITLLAPGSFQRYYDKKRSEGADLAHLKPPHMNASDEVIRNLVGEKTQT